MQLTAKIVPVQEIHPWRELYRQEMDCQIVHDSLHARDGWSQVFLPDIGEAPAGYG